MIPLRRLVVPLAALALAPAVVFPQAPDPSALGPHAVVIQEYTQGDTAFMPTDIARGVEITGAVFSPSDLENGSYPLVLYLHGRHLTCVGRLEWPCTGGRQPIKSYRGYDYSAQQLASHGLIVVSISANGVNANDATLPDLGARARAELIHKHLTMWRQFNTTGGSPFGTRFVGRVDLTRVGTMGHSRGGEGVMRHVVFNATQPNPFPIKAVVPIAPTNFSRWQVAEGIAVSQLLPYCDGDVSNIQGIHYYDDARYLQPTSGYQSYVAVMGGNHNFFNTQWTPGLGPGAGDDWSTNDPHCRPAGSGRLTAAQQRAVGLAYLSVFFRRTLGGEDALAGYVDGSAGKPPAVSAFSLHTSYHGNDTERRDVHRLLTAAELTTNSLGGAAAGTGVTPHDLCGGAAPQPQHCLASGQATSRQPHTAPSSRSTRRGLSQLRTGWSAAGASYRNEIPPGPARNVSGFDFLQFRAAVNYADTRNPAGQAKDFRVRFTDAAGASQTLRVGEFSNALAFPPGTSGSVPKLWHHSVRLPLAGLTVDRTRLSEVAFLFDQQPSGALTISDVHFYRRTGAVEPSFDLSAAPSERSILPGASTTFTVNVAPIAGFTGTVALAVTGLPTGATASFSPAAIVGGSGSSTLALATLPNTPTGRFTLNVTGTAGTREKTAAILLDVRPQTNVVFADDFEVDRGWTVNPAGTDTAVTGAWQRGNPQPTNSNGPKQLDATTSGVAALVTGLSAGSSTGANDIDGGPTSIQSPPFALTGGSPFTLTFSYYLAHDANGSTADFLRVAVVAGGTTTTVFEELGRAADDDAAWAGATVDLSAFAGQTIRLLIRAADAAQPTLVEAAVDDVRVTRQ